MSRVICKVTWELFKLIFKILGFFYDYILWPIGRLIVNLITSFWKALVIIGGYFREVFVYLGPILYDNAVIPLIKRNFGLILTIYPQLLVFQSITKVIGIGAYGTMYLIGEYIIKNLFLLISIIVILIAETLIKILKGISWVIVKIGHGTKIIYDYSAGIIVNFLIAVVYKII